jgi:hypothetical protein
MILTDSDVYNLLVTTGEFVNPMAQVERAEGYEDLCSQSPDFDVVD